MSLMLWLCTHVYLLYNISHINFKNDKHVAEKGGFEPPEPPPLDPALHAPDRRTCHMCGLVGRSVHMYLCVCVCVHVPDRHTCHMCGLVGRAVYMYLCVCVCMSLTGVPAICAVL